MREQLRSGLMSFFRGLSAVLVCGGIGIAFIANAQSGPQVTISALTAGFNGEVLCNPYGDGGAAVVPVPAGVRAVAVTNLQGTLVYVGFTSNTNADGGWPLTASSGVDSNSNPIPGGSVSLDMNNAPVFYCNHGGSSTMVAGAGLRWISIK